MRFARLIVLLISMMFTAGIVIFVLMITMHYITNFILGIVPSDITPIILIGVGATILIVALWWALWQWLVGEGVDIAV